MRGRKPTPTAVRALQGNPGKRPLNDEEPQPPAFGTVAGDEADPIPSELQDSATAVEEWRRLAPMLRRCRQITEADRGALVALCLEYARYVEATRKISELGMVVKAGKSGYPIPNPYLSIARGALAACTRLWPELGLTPSSRSRVKTTGPGPSGDEFSEFDDDTDLAFDGPTH